MIRFTRLLPALLATTTILGVACVIPPSPSVAQEDPLAAASAPRDLDRAVRDVEVMRRILAQEALGKGGARNSAGAYFDASRYYLANAGGNASAEAYFVDGQGATFILRTSDPVTAPEKGLAEGDETEPETLWDRTVADVEGRPRRRDVLVTNGGPVYDAAKVRALEDRILSQLAKFGTQMKELHSNENVVVIVQGGRVNELTVAMTAVNALKARSNQNGGVTTIVPRTTRHSIRTICVPVRAIHDVARVGGGGEALRAHAVIRAH